MYTYKLTDLEFNDSSRVPLGKLIVLIGPNNVGKSQALKDLAAIVTEGVPPRSVVVKDASWAQPNNLQELRDRYSVERFVDERNAWQFRILRADLSGEQHVGGGARWPEGYEHMLGPGSSSNKMNFAQNFGHALVAFLTTEQRLAMTKEAPSSTHEYQTANLLQSVYAAGSKAEKSISECVRDTFGQEIVLDFTVPQRLQFRLGQDLASLPKDPRDARPLMQKLLKLDDQGDGIRAFVGITSAVYALNRSLFLIDEPEAFLHPPQAFRMGQFLADAATDERQLVIATHSVDMLRGLIAKQPDVLIIRLDREGAATSFRQLDAKRLGTLVLDPLLSSARVLDGLFYNTAIVVEADSDARFYASASRKRTPNLDFHIVNADNKQTVARITQLYREMGVRAAGIVDFDVLNSRKEFEQALELPLFTDLDKAKILALRDKIAAAVGEIPPDTRLDDVGRRLADANSQVAQLQSQNFPSKADEHAAKEGLLRTLESRFYELAEGAKRWTPLKKVGVKGLPLREQEAFKQLANLCAQNGLFINPSGELEASLDEHGIQWTSDKKQWIRQALKLLPSLIVDDSKEPWAFLKRVHDYISPPTIGGSR